MTGFHSGKIHNQSHFSFKEWFGTCVSLRPGWEMRAITLSDVRVTVKRQGVTVLVLSLTLLCQQAGQRTLKKHTHTSFLMHIWEGIG